MGAIVVVIGLAVLLAGICVLFKTEKSAATWYYHEGEEALGSVPWIGDLLRKGIEAFTDSPAQGDPVAKVGYRVVDLHHRIGIFDVEEADSGDEAINTASMAGVSTVGVGGVFLLVGGFLAGSGRREN